MKKTISILLTLCILLLALSGCSGGAETPEVTQSDLQSAASDDMSNEQSSHEESFDEGHQGSAETPSDGYARYIELKGHSYDRISQKLEENDELALTVGMAILPVAMIDLYLIPLSVMGVEGGEAALGILSAQDVRVEQNGSSYSITYKDDEGTEIKNTCEYDKASDSMKAVVTEDGKEIVFFEYVNTGKAYASQYYAADEESGEYMWITCFFDESSVTAIGIDTMDKKPDSIIGNTGLNAEFVVNDEMYFILEDQELLVWMDGEKKTY